MARIITEKRSLLYFSVILFGSINSIKATIITARTLAEFRSEGWVISGTTPATYIRPGAWKAALRPLDAAVHEGQVWRVTSTSDTTFRFNKFISELCAKSIKVEVTLFMENTVVSVYPWKNPIGSEYFYPEQPSGIQWVTETIDIRPGNQIEFKMNVIPGGSGGYIFFDQINIEHDGVECEKTTTTEEPTTTDTTQTTEDSTGWTEETPVEESVEPGTGTTNTDEDTSSTTQMTTTEDPSTSTPEEGIPEEPETGGTDPTDMPTPTTDDPTAETTQVTDYPPTDSTSEDPTSSSTDNTSESTDGSTTIEDETTTGFTDSSTTVTDTTKSTDDTTTENSITGSTTEGDTESTVGSTTDESSESSTTLSPSTPSSLPPTSDTTSSSTESASENTMSTNTPTEGVTPPQPSSTSSTRIPVIILPPTEPLPGSEKQGLSVQQILLYIVLPTAVGITAFLGTVFYFGFKGYKWWGYGSKGSKEQLIRKGIERASSRRETGGGGGGSKNLTQISLPQQTSMAPAAPRQVGPAFPQSTSMQMPTTQLPRHSPSVLQSQFLNRNALGPRILPTSSSRPNMGKSVTLNMPNQEEIYYDTSEPSNWNRSPVTYTGEFTGGELPRIRRKMD